MANREDNLIKFKKGQSGNPAGRPPKTRIREWFDGVLSTRSEALRVMSRYEVSSIEKAMFSLTESELRQLSEDDSVPFYLKALSATVLSEGAKGKIETLERLRNRHYKEEEPTQPASPQLTVSAKELEEEEALLQSLMKEAGTYTPEYAAQISITAGVMVRLRKYQQAVAAEGYKNISVQISREGNRRELPNPNERLYLEYVDKAKSGLKALGLNFDSKDSKDRKTVETDDFNSFMNMMREDDTAGD